MREDGAPPRLARWQWILILMASLLSSAECDRGDRSPVILVDSIGAVKRPSGSQSAVGSQVDLLKPDRYEFYTFDETGDLVKRLMTLAEIQEIVASGDDAGVAVMPTIQDMENDPTSPTMEPALDAVVSSVQSVLQSQLQQFQSRPSSESFGGFDTPDVSHHWSHILPAVFGEPPDKNDFTEQISVIESTTHRIDFTDSTTQTITEREPIPVSTTVATTERPNTHKTSTLPSTTTEQKVSFVPFSKVTTTTAKNPPNIFDMSESMNQIAIGLGDKPPVTELISERTPATEPSTSTFKPTPAPTPAPMPTPTSAKPTTTTTDKLVTFKPTISVQKPDKIPRPVANKTVTATTEKTTPPYKPAEIEAIELSESVSNLLSQISQDPLQVIANIDKYDQIALKNGINSGNSVPLKRKDDGPLDPEDKLSQKEGEEFITEGTTTKSVEETTVSGTTLQFITTNLKVNESTIPTSTLTPTTMIAATSTINYIELPLYTTSKTEKNKDTTDTSKKPTSAINPITPIKQNENDIKKNNNTVKLSSINNNTVIIHTGTKIDIEDSNDIKKEINNTKIIKEDLQKIGAQSNLPIDKLVNSSKNDEPSSSVPSLVTETITELSSTKLPTTTEAIKIKNESTQVVKKPKPNKSPAPSPSTLSNLPIKNEKNNKTSSDNKNTTNVTIQNNNKEKEKPKVTLAPTVYKESIETKPTESTISQDDLKATTPIYVKILEDYIEAPKVNKTKLQKIELAVESADGVRNNSWKLVSTGSASNSVNNNNNNIKLAGVTSAKPLPAQRPKPLPEKTSNKYVDLEDVSQENQGLEATTKNLNQDIYQFAELSNELSFKYWNAVISEGIDEKRSIVVSPFAVISLLSMIFMGARGSTSGEMNEILRLDDMVTFNPHFVMKNVTESIEAARDSGVATSAFVRELYSDRSRGKVLGFFKDRAQQFYGAHVEEVNFKLISDIIRRRTNLLVKRHTRGKIPEYIKSNTIVLNSPLAAFSANIFQTECAGVSTSGRDAEMFFAVSPSVRQRRLVPVPAAVERRGFFAGYEPSLDATVAALRPDGAVSLLFAMPGQLGRAAGDADDGDSLAALSQRLTSSPLAWKRLLRAMAPRPGLELQFPRFQHRSAVDAGAALRRMGLKEVFDSEKADLRGLSGSGRSVTDLFLSDMLEVTTVGTCSETGVGGPGDSRHSETYPSEPGAAGSRRRRALYRDPASLPLHLRPRQARRPLAPETQPPRPHPAAALPRLRFDRPFLYFVRHNPTGMILYIGRYNPRLLP